MCEKVRQWQITSGETIRRYGEGSYNFAKGTVEQTTNLVDIKELVRKTTCSVSTVLYYSDIVFPQKRERQVIAGPSLLLVQ